MVRALACRARGCGFKSRHFRMIFKLEYKESMAEWLKRPTVNRFYIGSIPITLKYFLRGVAKRQGNRL